MTDYLSYSATHQVAKKQKRATQLFATAFAFMALMVLTCPNLLRAQTSSGDAELVKSLTQRTSIYSPETKVYHLQGDFQMIGNCNLTIQGGNPTAGVQNNSSDMQFVDIDGDANTVNSSSAQLKFSTERGANPECSRIVYAGLYWAGRKGSGSDPMSYTFGGTTTDVNVIHTATMNSTNSVNGYTLTISGGDINSTSNMNTDVTTYTFHPTNLASTNHSGDVVFTFRGGNQGTNSSTRTTFQNNTGSPTITVKIGTGTVQDISSSISTTAGRNGSNSSYRYWAQAEFTEPYVINTGNTTIAINTLRKRVNSTSLNTDEDLATISYSEPSTVNGYTLTITEVSGGTSTDNMSSSVTTYRFHPNNVSGTGSDVVFTFRGGNRNTSNYNDFRNNSGNSDILTVQVGNGAPQVLSSTNTATRAGNQGARRYTATATLTTPYVINTGNTSITINSLTKRTDSQTLNATDDKVNVTYGNSYTLTKNIVKFKHEDGTYQTITANTNDILYPSNEYSNIYVAYAEVTDIVRQYGEGNYYVADICTKDGRSDATGSCGGWGMVVIYENSQMKWRDITLFDGYAYVNGNDRNQEHWVNIDINGFKSVQVGHVNMTLGMMAAEGDAASYGDYAKIKALDGNYYFLNHDGQVTSTDYPTTDHTTTYNNFFNGETRNGGLARNPNYVNNMGVDLLMIPLENANNSIITNNQTSTSFRFGSKQEIYVPFCFVFGCDAYIPDAQAVDAVYENDAAVYDPAMDVWVSHPGDTVTFTIKVHNYDLEDVRDALISLPLPPTVELYDLEAEYSDGRTGESYFNPLEGVNGTAHWTIDYLPAGYPDSAWATFKLHCYITTDCHVLASTSRDCLLDLVVNGTLAGTSVINGLEFEHPFIQGFVQNGVCRGNAISEDLRVIIDRTDYVNRYCNCSNVEGEFSTECYENREVRFCSADGTVVPFDEVASLYPEGTRFFLESDRDQEFTRESNFPQAAQNVPIVAVLPTNGECESSLILVLTAETPTIDNPTLVNSPITYCLNETPTPLSQSVTISDTAKTTYGAYVIFFKENPGDDPVHSGITAYNDITPNTSVAGTTTYWVVQLASAPGAECYYSDPIELEVVVKSPFQITNVDGATTCKGAPVTFTADVPGGQYIIPDSVQSHFNVSGPTATLLGTAPAGTYTFEYVAPPTLDDDGCPLAMTQQITHTITPITNGGHVVPANNPTICQGSPVPDFTIENMTGRVLRWEYIKQNSNNTWPSEWTTISNSTNTLTQASLEELTSGTYRLINNRLISIQQWLVQLTSKQIIAIHNSKGQT